MLGLLFEIILDIVVEGGLEVAAQVITEKRRLSPKVETSAPPSRRGGREDLAPNKPISLTEYYKNKPAPPPELHWSRALKVIGASFMYFMFGLVAGTITLAVVPYSIVRSSSLHGISLLIVPLVAGFAMTGIGWLRKRKGQPVLRLDTFGYAFVFAFGMELMRLLLALPR